MKYGFTLILIFILLLVPALHRSALSQENPSSAAGVTSDEEENNKPLGTVQKITFTGLNAMSEEVVADVATIQVGDTFTRQKLEYSINDLRKWGVFSKVEVLVQYDDGGVELTYELEEGFIIKEISIKGNYPLLKSKVQRALFLSPGTIYDNKKLPEQIERLDRLYEQEGYFRTTVLAIEDYDTKNREVSLQFRIQKGITYELGDYTIQGNTALSPMRIRTIIFTYSHYKPKQIKEDMQKITDLYKKKGFVRARVRLGDEYYDYDAKEVDLEVLIRQGPRVKVEFEGNKSFFDRTLKKHITVFEDGDFDEFELDASKKKLMLFYQRRGFEDVQVEWTRTKIDPNQKKAETQPSPETQGSSESQPETQPETQESKPGPVLEVTNVNVNRLREKNEKLRKKQAVGAEKEPDYYLVTFKIQEGTQTQVKAIEFDGNENIKSKRLRNMMATKENSIGERGYYLQPLFMEDLRTIESYYREEGYLNAEVESWEKSYSPLKDKVTLDVDIQEGPRAGVQEVRFEGLTEAEEAEIRPRLLLQPGKPYSPYILSQDLQTILVMLANQGYPYTEVSHDVTEPGPHQYNILFKVDKIKQVKIGRILFVGNTLTKESVIRNNLRIQEGDIFSTKNLLQSQINLRGLGVFNLVNIETLGLTSQRETVNVVVRVAEKKTKVLDFEIGYNTDFGFSGQVIFNKLNLWGRGKNGNIKGQLGQEISRLEINYVDPRLMGTSLQLVVGAFGGIERRPFFTSTTVGGYGTLFKTFGRNLSGYGRLDLNYVDNNDNDTVFEKLNPNQNPNKRTRFITTLGTTYDTRDNFGDPRRGLYLNSTVALTNEFIQTSGNYATLRANIGYWYSPFSRVTIANALRVAQIFTFPSSTVVPTDARLYLGGDSTVRGFKQDSLLPSGGTFSLVHNLELQFRLFGNFQVVGFLDTGVVTNGVSEVSLTTLRHSAGPGVRYVTPVGPIRVDYGFVLDPEAGDATSQRLHFSFGYFF